MPASVITGSPEPQITGFGRTSRPMTVVSLSVIGFPNERIGPQGTHTCACCGRGLVPISHPCPAWRSLHGGQAASRRPSHAHAEPFQVRHAAAADRDHARLGGEAGRASAGGATWWWRRTRRRRRARSSMPRRRSAGCRRDLLAKATQAALAAGAAGRAARRLLLSGADRAPARGDQLPRDLQRPYRRAHHGLRAGLRARAARLHSAAIAPRVEEAGARISASCTCRKRRR